MNTLSNILQASPADLAARTAANQLRGQENQSTLRTVAHVILNPTINGAIALEAALEAFIFAIPTVIASPLLAIANDFSKKYVPSILYNAAKGALDFFAGHTAKAANAFVRSVFGMVGSYPALQEAAKPVTVNMDDEKESAYGFLMRKEPEIAAKDTPKPVVKEQTAYEYLMQKERNETKSEPKLSNDAYAGLPEAFANFAQNIPAEVDPKAPKAPEATAQNKPAPAPKPEEKAGYLAMAGKAITNAKDALVDFASIFSFDQN